MSAPAFIVGIGGSPRPESSTERALRFCLSTAAERGAEVECYSGSLAGLPLFSPEQAKRSGECRRLLAALRRADGVIIATPGYHGAISGLVKNALDYVEDLREDRRPYLEGRAVACIACAAGAQTAVTALVGLRSIVHALRGWPTPLGVAINSSTLVFDAAGGCVDQAVADQLTTATKQVLAFADAGGIEVTPALDQGRA